MWQFGFTALWLLVLAVLDIKERHVPVWMIALGGTLAAATSAVSIWQGTMQGGELLWSIAPGAIMLAVVIFTKQAGWADGAVLVAVGLLTGSHACVFSFALSMFLIPAVSLPLLVLRKVRKNTRLPYLPFLCTGYLVQAAVKFMG